MPSGKEKEHIMTRKIHAIVPASRDEFLQPFHTVFDQILGETFPDMSREIGHDFFAKGAYPRVDVVDGDEAIYIEAEIPGLTKDDVSVDVKDNLLTISGRRKGIHENDKNTRYIVKELKRSQFSRSFTLTDKLDAANIEAQFDKGLLTIVVPKLEPAKPVTRNVDIK